MKARSERREERLERIGARGPVCDEVKRYACASCRAGRSDPAHVRGDGGSWRVGKGYGDFEWIAERATWECRVGPACRGCHDRLDGNAQPALPRRAALSIATQGVAIGKRWAKEIGVDLADAMHPYEQMRARGLIPAGDIPT